ncbi:ead/Ea22-like family protein [Escherichia coli]|uniref:ead/Ea22-like family protein n=2 Tax=Escherichia coli TaxID=562 RepID=UPI003013C6F5
MNKIDYQALREAAEKATCGVWSLEYGEERFDAGDALIHREVVGYLPICRIEGAHPESGFDEDFQMEQQANAEFISAANPATVLALLGELEAAKKRIAELEAEPVSQTCKLNEPSGNSPVTPDGWISCSERMPGYPIEVLVAFKSDADGEPCLDTGVAILFPDGKWRGGGVFYVMNGDRKYQYRECVREVTHWMPLPEPPQEVK